MRNFQTWLRPEITWLGRWREINWLLITWAVVVGAVVVLLGGPWWVGWLALVGVLYLG
jgi:hypothetical protein